MKIKIFTHTDLDGYGCAILARLVAGEDNVEESYCGYYDINEKIISFIENKEYNNYDHIFITDISVLEETAELIESVQEECDHKFYLLDHHPTAMFLNKYHWARVQIEDSIEKVCGTSLFYETLLEYSFFDNLNHNTSIECVKDFVETVKRYDTWLWNEKYNDSRAKHLNDLFNIYGSNRFADSYTHRLKYSKVINYSLINDTDRFLLELEEDKAKKYIYKKNKEMEIREKEINGKLYKFGIVVADDYISLLGSKLCESNPGIDFVAIVSSLRSVSFRTVKDNIDLGCNVASYYGGGGHPKAAGSQIAKELKKSILDAIFF